ncbi:MAG: response regulator, partial [Proteobacteria bacterium]|nr:response regulator [Pseudomonadota bacterium]
MEAIESINQSKTTILIVDDEEFNRMILEMHLGAEGYETVSATDGEDAWEKLTKEDINFSTILLDRNMPRLDGMGLLERIKKDKRYIDIPVVFQTALDDEKSISEGVNAGAFHYLTKPFNQKSLLAVVKSALATYELLCLKDTLAVVNEQTPVFSVLNYAELKFQSLDEARSLAQSIAKLSVETQEMVLGLTELFINAVEHGNLGITYHEKTQLVNEQGWEEEVDRRINLEEHQGKWVRVKVTHSGGQIIITITDEGNGFDWEPYLEISSERAFDPHGRGIAMSRMLSFDS